MKKFRLLQLGIILSVFTLVTFCYDAKAQSSKQYFRKVNRTVKHLHKEFTNNTYNQGNPRKEEETPLGWWIQDYVATMDPSLGRPTPEILIPEIQKLSNRGINQRAQPGGPKTQWQARGPNNLAGRSRCVEFDPTDPLGKKVWAGAVTGGLWYNNDISSSTSKWISVSDLWSNITVTAIAFDPNNPGTMYVGTGEGWGTTTSSSRGYGIFKSTDSGRSFQHLSSTAGYYYINDIIVRNESGSSVVYAAVDVLWFSGIWQGSATSPGVYKSTNGGTSFSNLNLRPSGQSFNYAPSDFELDAYNRLWVATRQNSATGTSDKGGGRILYTDDGKNFTESYKYKTLTSRVELGVSPNHLAVYAMIESSGKADTLIKSLDRGATWIKMTKPIDSDNGITKTDFSRNQAWYDWIMAVNPKDSNILVCGAIDAFYSKNGGSSWVQASKWSNNPGLDKLTCSYVHADIHALKFNEDGKRFIIGCDGGVFYSADINNNPSTNSSCILERNNELLITQFYCGDISQTKGSNLMIAGAQDNGPHMFLSSGLNDKQMITGGDGGYCFISSLNDNKQVVSYVYNQFFGTTNNWSSFTKLIDDGASGKFINPAVLDPIGDLLFTGKSGGVLYRNKLGNASTAASTVTFGTTSTGSASAFLASKSASGKPQIYVGTDVGQLLVTTDGSVTTPSFTTITGSINAGNISSIYRLKLTDTLFVTLSNYGINHIYYSPDAGKTWVARDGNLPNLPVWSILVNPNKNGEALIATELGIYGTSNIYASSVSWSPYNIGMGPVKTLGLKYRDIDRIIMAVTHGRGVFTSDAWSKESPIAKFGADKKSVCATETISFSDSSLYSPINWNWTITPSTGVVYKSGTNSKSRNPKIQFTKGGKYEISLQAGNDLGSDILTKQDYIDVVDSLILLTDIKSSLVNYCARDTFNLRAVILDTNIKSTSIGVEWFKNGSTIAGQTGLNLYGLTPKKGDIYSCKLISSQYCINPNSSISIDTIKQVSGVVSLTISRFMDTFTASNVGTGTYFWYKNGVSVGYGRVFKASSNGNYRCVYVENGCYSDSSNAISFNSLQAFGIDIPGNAVFYPTITSDEIIIKDPKNIGHLDFYNGLGQWVIRVDIAENTTIVRLKDYSLSSGNYNIVIYNKSGLCMGNSRLIYRD